MDEPKQYPDTRAGTIQYAYDELPDAEQLQIDLQVKRLLDYVEALNFTRRARNVAIIQMSRAGALEILYGLGRLNPWKD